MQAHISVLYEEHFITCCFDVMQAMYYEFISYLVWIMIMLMRRMLCFLDGLHHYASNDHPKAYLSCAEMNSRVCIYREQPRVLHNLCSDVHTIVISLLRHQTLLHSLCSDVHTIVISLLRHQTLLHSLCSDVHPIVISLLRHQTLLHSLCSDVHTIVISLLRHQTF